MLKSISLLIQIKCTEWKNRLFKKQTLQLVICGILFLISYFFIFLCSHKSEIQKLLHSHYKHMLVYLYALICYLGFVYYLIFGSVRILSASGRYTYLPVQRKEILFTEFLLTGINIWSISSFILTVVFLNLSPGSFSILSWSALVFFNLTYLNIITLLYLLALEGINILVKSTITEKYTKYYISIMIVAIIYLVIRLQNASNHFLIIHKLFNVQPFKYIGETAYQISTGQISYPTILYNFIYLITLVLSYSFFCYLRKQNEKELNLKISIQGARAKTLWPMLRNGNTFWVQFIKDSRLFWRSLTVRSYYFICQMVFVFYIYLYKDIPIRLYPCMLLIGPVLFAGIVYYIFLYESRAAYWAFFIPLPMKEWIISKHVVVFVGCIVNFAVSCFIFWAILRWVPTFEVLLIILIFLIYFSLFFLSSITYLTLKNPWTVSFHSLPQATSNVHNNISQMILMIILVAPIIILFIMININTVLSCISLIFMLGSMVFYHNIISYLVNKIWHQYGDEFLILMEE